MSATLGQEGKAAVLRVRSCWSTLNGTWPSLRFPGAFAGLRPGDRFKATAVWRNGEARLQVTGERWRYEAIFRPGPARLYRLRGMGEFLEPKATPFLDTVASSLVAFPGGFVAAGTTAAVVGSFALLAITVATAVFLPLLASATPAVVLPSLAFGATAGAVVGWLLGLLGFQRGRARAG